MTHECWEGDKARTAAALAALARVALGRLQHEQRLHEHVRGRLAHELAHKVLQVLKAGAGLAGALLQQRRMGTWRWAQAS